MLPASVTVAVGATARARAASSGIAGTGAQTMTMSASATASSRDGAARSEVRSAACARDAGSTSHPETSHPTLADAIAIDVPIRPVPTIAMRSAPVEVIA